MGMRQHLHKAFLRPYGRAEGVPDNNGIMRIMNFKNSECFCHPHVAMSELSDTMQENMAIIDKFPLNNKRALQEVLTALATFTKTLQPFKRGSAFVPTVENANNFMQDLIPKNSIDNFIEQAFEVSGALFSTSLNYLVACKLLCQPKQYADALKMKLNKHLPFQ